MIAALLLAATAPSAIDAENAFARDAQRIGQWTAFRKYADHDAVMFTPQAAWVRDLLKDAKDPPRSVRWWPAHSFVSCDGRTAVNTGPWIRPNNTHGYFTTVWQRTGVRWRWVYDGGDTLKGRMPAVPRPRTVRAACRGNAPGAPIIAQCFIQQFFILTRKLWVRVGESLDCLVNVLPVIDAHRPVLKGLYRVFSSSAHFWIRVCLFNDCGPVRCECCLVSEIIEGDDRAFKRDLFQILRTDLIQCFVRLCDGFAHHRLDRLRRLLPIGNRQDSIGLRGRSSKVIDSFEFSSRKIMT